MRTEEFQKCHYCQWRKTIRNTPLEEVYLRSLKQVRKEGFRHTSVMESELFSTLKSEWDKNGGSLNSYRMGEDFRYDQGSGTFEYLMFREMFSLVGFALHGKRVIEFSRDLGECLSRTDLNIKTSEFKVLYPSVYVVIPEGIDFYTHTDVGPRRVEGIYVTICGDPESDAVMRASGGKTVLYQGKLIPRSLLEKIIGSESVEDMVRSGVLHPESVKYGGLYALFFCIARDGIAKDYSDFTYHFFQYSFPPDGEACMLQDILKEDAKKWGKRVQGALKESIESSPAIASLIFNLFIYMAQEKKDMVVKENRRMVYLRSQHGLSREGETEMLVKYAASGEFELVSVGCSSFKSPRRELGGTHDSPAGHWRRGHWHRYWIGVKKDGQKVEFRWIQPLYIRGKTEDPRAKLVKVK